MLALFLLSNRNCSVLSLIVQNLTLYDPLLQLAIAHSCGYRMKRASTPPPPAQPWGGGGEGKGGCLLCSPEDLLYKNVRHSSKSHRKGNFRENFKNKKSLFRYLGGLF
jgi:hypothetical protein